MINALHSPNSGQLKSKQRFSRGRLLIIAGLLAVVGIVVVVRIFAATNSQIKTVFIVMMENTDWSQVKGSSSYPYLNNTLLPNSAYANNYIGGIGHPSLPNYVTLEAGDPMGLTDGSWVPPTHSTNTTAHLTTQLRAAGISWKYYAENLPGNGTTCNITDPGTPYSLDHNPYVYFDDVRNDAAYCQSHERPYSEFAGDLTNNTVPAYNFIVPNDWDQGEKLASGSNCMACQADNFLKSEIPKIQASAAYKNGGVIIVLWDENGYTGNYPSGMIINSPLGKKNYSNNIAYNHGSTLRTMQTIFGVGPLLRMAATATDLADFFTVPLTGGTTSTPTPSTITPSPTPLGTPVPGTLSINDATIGTGLNQFNFSGTWATSAPVGAYSTDNHYGNVTGDYYAVQFSGNQAKIYAEKSSGLGIYGVSIDGGTETMVDAYAATRSEQQLLYTSPTLTNATHTLKVRITGTKNAASTGTYASADRVDIVSGTSTTPAPTPVPSTPTPTLAPATSYGDINRDGNINVFDLSILLSKWGTNGN